MTVNINGQPACALMDCGSEANFLSTTLIDQLQLVHHVLAKPLNIRLAVHGSQSKTNADVLVDFGYQNISESRHFDIANLDAYNMILGTPSLWRHKIWLGFNPSSVVVGSDVSLEMRGDEVNVINSAAADIFEEDLQQL